MRIRLFLSLSCLLSIIACTTSAALQAPVSPSLLTQKWSAWWIAPLTPSPRAYGVHHFRKTFELASIPSRFVVHISADNRYRVFVNGQPVHIGPARGDLAHWRFDSLDLAAFLRPGPNVLAAQVWNFGTDGPVAQETDQTAFILQGNSPTESIVDTNNSWRVFTNLAYTPITGFEAKLQTYIVVGPGDDVDGAQYPWGWHAAQFDDHAWTAATVLRPGAPRGISTDGKWLLVPRQIPLMEASPTRLKTVRRADGIETSDAFLAGEAPLTIPAHTTATLLLDQGEITTAFPRTIHFGRRR